MTEEERKWIDCHFEKVREEVVKNRIDIATLKVKAGIWGLLGGLIPVLVMMAMLYFVTKG